MLMQHPNKSRVTTIIASIKKQKGMGDGEGGREEYTEEKGPRTETGLAKESAMESFLSAVDKKDPRGMMRALETFYDLCSMAEESAEGEKPSDEEYG